MMVCTCCQSAQSFAPSLSKGHCDLA